MPSNNRRAPGVTNKTAKELWVRADNECSICNYWLKQDNVVIGENAHIVDESLDGNLRADPDQKILPLAERNKQENLILLCNNCHQKIDDTRNLELYTIEKLREIKKSHEAEVERKRSRPVNQNILDFYKDLANTWAELAHFENWVYWTSKFDPKFYDEPFIFPENHEHLEALYQWLFTRIWPDEAEKELIAAFENFSFILNVLFDIFHKADMKWEFYPYKNDVERVLVIKDFINRLRIKNRGFVFDDLLYSEEKYERDFQKIKKYAPIFIKILNELTRAANYISTLIRQKNIDPLFRLKEGLVVTNLIDRNGLQYDNLKYIYPFKETKEYEVIKKILVDD